jgi:hypothetical protein
MIREGKSAAEESGYRRTGDDRRHDDEDERRDAKNQ